LLSKSIIAYNVEHLKQSLVDGSYRGEAGMLRIRPELATSLGLNVFVDEDYHEAKKLYQEADELFEAAVAAMVDRRKEKYPGAHAEKLGNLAVSYNTAQRSARQHMMAYASRLKPGVDDRLEEGICSPLMKDLLEKSLAKTHYNLREALAHFYNRCQDLEEDDGPLTPENVKFVNHVFLEFTSQAGAATLRQFDLDKPVEDPTAGLSNGWRHTLGAKASQHLAMVESVMGNDHSSKPTVDAILFLALMRQESNFNHRDISSVGAAGLTQIMPQTAIDLGMKNIYMPPYLEDAGSLLRKERRLSYRARSLIPKITPENKDDLAARARAWMQEALEHRRKAKKLYAQYRQELLNGSVDDRLDPQKAIRYGYTYFSRMMKIQKGDISLALASYNAGPHRVEQYQGIPPLDETVSFRNRVMRYYREYLSRVERYRTNDAPPVR